MIHGPSHGSFAIDLFEIDQQLLNQISESGVGVGWRRVLHWIIPCHLKSFYLSSHELRSATILHHWKNEMEAQPSPLGQAPL